MATSLVRTSNLALARGHLAQAQADAQASVGMLEPLVAQQPDNRTWRRDLAHAYAQAGWVTALDGHAAAATRQLTQARQTLAGVLAHQPLPEWEWLDAIIALRLNRVQGLHGDRQTASLAATVARLDALHQAKPADLIGAGDCIGLVWRTAGRQRRSRRCTRRLATCRGSARRRYRQ